MTSPPGAGEVPSFVEFFGIISNPFVGIPLCLALFGYGAYRSLLEPSTEVRGVRWLRAVDKGLARIEEMFLAAALVVLIFLATYQAYKRNYAPPAPYWTDELIRYAVFAIGLLGAALATQSERLINVDLFTRVMTKRGRLIAKVLTAVFTIYMAWWFVKGGLHVRRINQELHESGEVIAPATAILALPIGAALIGLHLTLHSLIDLYYLVTGKEAPLAMKAPV
jgi:TRAP-type C4-dicarboxylate transport system permease small subunit